MMMHCGRARARVCDFCFLSFSLSLSVRYEEVLGDPRLAPMFDEPLVSMQWLKHHQYQFLSRLFQQSSAETVYVPKCDSHAHPPPALPLSFPLVHSIGDHE